jgi:aspartate aminotransferase
MSNMISNQVAGYIERASWIRRMFETGAELKARHGADRVFDFSLGNPDVPPPPDVGRALSEVAAMVHKPLSLGYMPNAGYPDLREAMAARLSAQQGVTATAADLILTCGAAGGLNAFFKAVLEPGDQVLCPAPFFVEYGFYAANHGGELVTVKCREPDFGLDLEAMAEAVTDRTRVVLINSPNNPTGAVYPREALEALAEVLTARSAEYGRPVYLLSDEPYRFLTFDGTQVPPLVPVYPYSAVVSSYSKSLSLAGERVGYVLLNPEMPGKERLMEGLVLANRILGFVNAPAVGQAVLARCLDAGTDTGVYESRRAAMAEALSGAGYEFPMPQGAFYFFCKAPGGDDVAFCDKLQKELILAVPGSGFGYPGYFRLSFCVDESVIRGAAPGLARAFSA